jgi:hypothetical protein
VEWIVTTAVVVAILILAVFLGSKRRKEPSRVPSGERVEPAKFSPTAPTKSVQSKLSAAELLCLVHRLRDQNVQWDVIWSAVNPTNDAEVQRLLVEIRGPHMFAPHLGLSVIEDGCRRVLASSPNADALAALREAIRRQDPFVR